MALQCLIQITPFDPVAGERLSVRAAHAQDRRFTGLGGMRWHPAIVKAPALSWQAFEGDFSTGTGAGSASFELSLLALQDEPVLAQVRRCFWQGADVTIHVGDAQTVWPWPTVFAGQVSQASEEGGRLKVTATVDAQAFEADVLTATYAGTGGAEGGEDIKGQVKPLAIGRPLNCEPVLINAVDSIYQFSAYGPIEAVDVLYERGSDFGPSAGNHASYAALQAASISPGAWATCLAEGLIRLGAPAYGVITGDIKGHKVGASSPRLTGAIIAALADLAGIDSARLASGSLGALDTEVPRPISLYLKEQQTFAALATRLVLPCNAQAGVSLDGQFYVARVDISEPEVIDLHAQGKRMPQVVRAKERNVSAPYAKVIFGARRAWRVHSPDEVASAFLDAGDVAYADGTPIEDLKPAAPGATANVGRGNFSSLATYYPGDVVLWATADGGDGNGYIRIGAGATTGPLPSDATYWAALVQRGEDGAPGSGAAAIEATLQPPALMAKSYANGGITDWSGLSATVRILQSTTNIAASFALSVIDNPQNLTVGIVGAVVSITGAGTAAGEFANEEVDRATLTIRATGSGSFAGVTRDMTMSLAKARGGYEIVGSLPTTNLFAGRIVSLSSSGYSLYRYTGTAWTSKIASSDVDGQIEYEQLANGAVRVQHLLIAPKSLVVDPHFESGAVGWTGFAESQPRSHASVPSGCPTAFASRFTGRDNSYARRLAVKVGETYRISGWVNRGTGSGGGGVGFFGATWTAAGVRSGFVFPDCSTTASGWVYLEGRYQIPADMVELEYGPWADRPSYTGEAWYADFNIEKMADASLIVDGQVTTNKLAAGSVTAGKIAASAIEAIHIQAGTIVASKFVTDQGVDLAALVPGQFNSSVAASGGISQGEDQVVNFAQTAAISASSADYITINTSVTITGGTTNGSNKVELVRVRSGTHTVLSTTCCPANGSPGTVTITHEDTSHGGGSIYYYLRAVTAWNEFNDPSMYGSGSLTVRKFFIK